MEGLAIVVAAIGAINWGLIGLFRLDLVAAISTAGRFGDTNVVSRVVYVIFGVAGVIALVVLSANI